MVTCSAGDTKVAGSNPASVTPFCPQDSLLLVAQCFGGHFSRHFSRPRALLACVSCN